MTIYACDLLTLALIWMGFHDATKGVGDRNSAVIACLQDIRRTTALKLLTSSYRGTVFQRGRQLKWFGLALSTHMVAGGKTSPATYTWNI